MTDERKSDELESEGGIISHSPAAVRVRSEGPSWIQIEHGFGKNAVLILWISSFISALAAVGLFVAYQGYKDQATRTNILEYDLMDLRSKTGHAHENTPEPEN
jgi:hypothetical protein